MPSAPENLLRLAARLVLCETSLDRIEDLIAGVRGVCSEFSPLLETAVGWPPCERLLRQFPASVVITSVEANQHGAAVMPLLDVIADLTARFPNARFVFVRDSVLDGAAEDALREAGVVACVAAGSPSGLISIVQRHLGHVPTRQLTLEQECLLGIPWPA
ncbi:MAG: hypothetical protein KDA42_10595 [Planctomycetales bacterium]|nr:hypothetical protein [Planctomycetales bacterium]